MALAQKVDIKLVTNKSIRHETVGNKPNNRERVDEHETLFYAVV